MRRQSHQKKTSLGPLISTPIVLCGHSSILFLLAIRTVAPHRRLGIWRRKESCSAVVQAAHMQCLCCARYLQSFLRNGDATRALAYCSVWGQAKTEPGVAITIRQQGFQNCYIFVSNYLSPSSRNVCINATGTKDVNRRSSAGNIV